MKVSTKGRYALRMMIDLAVYGEGEFISLRDVARRQQVSIKYMEQIVGLLTKAGFLYSVRGPQGGYKLARSPDDYTVGDILRITEGSLAPVSCLLAEPNGCARMEHCATLKMWQGLHEHINAYVDNVTLAELVDRQMELGLYDLTCMEALAEGSGDANEYSI